MLKNNSFDAAQEKVDQIIGPLESQLGEALEKVRDYEAQLRAECCCGPQEWAVKAHHCDPCVVLHKHRVL